MARRWFKTVGADLDGIIAKRLDCPYRSGERTGMEKVKLTRAADCVAGGFRYASQAKVVGCWDSPRSPSPHVGGYLVPPRLDVGTGSASILATSNSFWLVSGNQTFYSADI